MIMGLSMLNYSLGDKVRVSDYLVRAIDPRAELLGDYSFDNYDGSGRVWIPDSLYKSIGCRLDDKHHGYPRYLELPLEGIIVGKKNLSDGVVGHSGDEGFYFVSSRFRTSYQVAYRLDRKPLLCYTDFMMEGTL